MKRTGKRSLIACIIALSLVLTGIAYAYWTDTLNVTTNATTGDLDVTFVDLGIYAQYYNETVDGSWSIIDGIGNGFTPDNYFLREASDYNIIAKPGTIADYYARAKGYNNIEFDAELVGNSKLTKDWGDYKVGTNNSDQIVLSISNMYPGFAQAFRTDILNVGSIAAKLSSLKFGVSAYQSNQLTPATKGMMGVALYIEVDNKPGTDVFKLCSTFANGNNYFTLGGVDFLRFDALEGLSDADIRAALHNNEMLCYADASHRMDLIIAIAMDPDAVGTYTSGSTELPGFEANQWKDASSQNAGVTLSIDLAWDQFNVGVDAGIANILKEQNVKK